MLRELPIYPKVSHLSPDVVDVMTDLAFGCSEEIVDPFKTVDTDTIFTFSNGLGFKEQGRVLSRIFNDKSNHVRQLVLTGGKPWEQYPDEEPNLIEAQSVVLFKEIDKVPKETKVGLETQSVNTKENASYGWAALPTRPANDVIVVSLNFHIGRCNRTFQAEALKHDWNGVVRLLPYTSNITDGKKSVLITRENWMEDPLAQSRVVGELQRIKKYGARGDVLLLPGDREKLDFVNQHCALG